jgi:hypothetical protein
MITERMVSAQPPIETRMMESAGRIECRRTLPAKPIFQAGKVPA